MGTSVATQFEHRLILSSISQKLGRQELEELLFICEAFFPESIAEETPSVIALFRELEHRILIGPGNYKFLETILTNIGRIDLANKLPQAKTKPKSAVPACTKKTVATNDKRSVLLVVADSLRKNDIPDNYSYLARKFSMIGRYDLSQLLSCKSSDYEIVSGKTEIASW